MFSSSEMKAGVEAFSAEKGQRSVDTFEMLRWKMCVSPVFSLSDGLLAQQQQSSTKTFIVLFVYLDVPN